MTLAVALLALLNHRQVPNTTQDPRTFHVGPELVTLRFPAPSPDAAPSSAVSEWPGWTSIAGANPVFDRPYVGAGDWSEVERSYLAYAGKEEVSWRLKVVVIASIDNLYTHENGVLEDRRNTITGPRFLETLDSIPQFVALVDSLTGGRVRVNPEVLIDPEPSRDRSAKGVPDFDSEYLNRYLEGRINGGNYEADDRVYRGPFNSVLFIDPCASFSPQLENPQSRVLPRTFSIAGTPSGRVSFDSCGGGTAHGLLAVALLDSWLATVCDRAMAKGLRFDPDGLKSLDWKALAELDEPSTDVLLARLGAHPVVKRSVETLPANLLQPAYKTGNVKLAVVKDQERGDVIQYVESRDTREGGFALPHGASPIDTLKTPSLSFAYKTTSDRTLSLTLHDIKGNTRWVSLGNDPAPSDPLIPRATSVPLSSDGAWHTVTVDLRGTGADPVDQIRIGTSPSAAVLTPDVSIPVTYEFSDFKLSAEPATPTLSETVGDPNSADPQARCLAAVQAGRLGKGTPELAKLLKDKDDSVVLNAAAAYQNVEDSFAEQTLIGLASSPSPRIAEYALKALEHQGTPTAKSAVEQVMRSGFEYSREVAALLIAGRHDPATAEQVVVLLAGRLWHTRLAAVQALGQIPGRPAALMRLAMLQQDDPVIKLAAIEYADTKQDTDMRKLLWTAVNEPSDLVRASACCKLIQSDLPNMRSEGLKGVRDDSWWTRLIVLKFLEKSPIEAARGAVKLGLTDRSARVRAAAIDALSAFSQVTLIDVESCLMDPNPNVELALIGLAKKHNLKLPDSTMELLRKSPDARVVTGLGR